MKTMQEFINENKISMAATWADNNPNMEKGRGMDHWKVRLKIGRKSMTTYFSMGYGHGGKEPKAAEVLDCLASDSSSIDNARNFEEWAGDLGYNPDSRKAERTFKVCESQAAKLKAFLGDEKYQQLLYDTERL